MKKKLLDDLTTLTKKVEEFETFLSGLTVLDKMNFDALVRLGAKSIVKLPEGQYRDMAILVLAVAESKSMSNKGADDE